VRALGFTTARCCTEADLTSTIAFITTDRSCNCLELPVADDELTVQILARWRTRLQAVWKLCIQIRYVSDILRSVGHALSA
jgi:hypothetical protein